MTLNYIDYYSKVVIYISKINIAPTDTRFSSYISRRAAYSIWIFTSPAHEIKGNLLF